jgi:rhodanese-related sulfurtransferase
MQTKKVGIIASIVIGIAVISTISLGQYNYQEDTDIYSIDQKTLFSQLENNEPIFIVDIRTAEEFQTRHLDGASHDILDSTTLEKRVTTIQNRLPEIASKYNLVLVDDDGTKAKHVAQTMTEMGIQTFYLKGGMNDLSENLVSSSQTIITSEELMQKIMANEDLFLLDVRESEELLESKIEGVVNIPLAQIFEPNGMDEIPTDKQVVVICGSGNRATIATYALAQNGIDFQVLEGGMNAWNTKTDKQSEM